MTPNPLLFSAALIAATTGFALAIDSAKTQTSTGEHCDSSARHTLITCPGERASELDKKLAQAVRRQRALIQQKTASNDSDGKTLLEQFDAANDHWLKMRTAECGWRSQSAHGDYSHMRSAKRIRCAAAMTEARLKQLQAGAMYGPGERTRASEIPLLPACGERPPLNRADAPSVFKNCYLRLANGLELSFELSQRPSKGTKSRHDRLQISWPHWPVEGDSLSFDAYSPPDPQSPTPQGVSHVWKIVQHDLDNDGIGETLIPIRFHRPFLMQLALITAQRHNITKTDLYSLKPISRLASLPAPAGEAAVLVAHDRSNKLRLHVLYESVLYPSVVVIGHADGRQCRDLAEADPGSASWIDDINTELGAFLPKSHCS